MAAEVIFGDFGEVYWINGVTEWVKSIDVNGREVYRTAPASYALRSECGKFIVPYDTQNHAEAARARLAETGSIRIKGRG